MAWAQIKYDPSTKNVSTWSDGTERAGPADDRGLLRGAAEQDVRGAGQVRAEDDGRDGGEQGAREEHVAPRESGEHQQGAGAGAGGAQERAVQVCGLWLKVHIIV